MLDCVDRVQQPGLAILDVVAVWVVVFVEVPKKCFPESDAPSVRPVDIKALGDCCVEIFRRDVVEMPARFACGEQPPHQLAVLVVRMRASGFADEAAVLFAMLAHFDIISS